MATQAKFNTVLPSNTIQQGLNYTGISSVYASKLNTLGQAENVMTANDVELSLNTYNPGATASINIPASYKLLGNMYLKMVVSLKTLLAAPNDTDSYTYREIYNDYVNKTSGIVFSNCSNKISARGAVNPAAPLDIPPPVGCNLGSLNTGLPMDINFLAYQLVKQFTYRIPGCDRIYVQGIHMLPWILDKCPTEEEKIKLAMMSGSSQFLYSHSMKQANFRQSAVGLKKSTGNEYIAQLAPNAGVIAASPDNPAIILNELEDPQFVIYALLPCPWTTIDKDKPALYYPSHMTTSALELNIQFQDAAYLKVPAESGYSGYQVNILEASLRFTYAQVATLTYYKPPIYKLPCSLPYGFTFPVKDYQQTETCSVNLLGLKNGEITQLMMFLHQQTGSTFEEVSSTLDRLSTSTSMRYKWRNEMMKNVQVEYAGQIIWKGLDDNYDFMNQFDNRKTWSSFKFPTLLTVKTVDNNETDNNYTIGSSFAPNGAGSGILIKGLDPNKYYPSYNRGDEDNALSRYYIQEDENINLSTLQNYPQPHSDYFWTPKVSLSNFYDVSSCQLGGSLITAQLSIDQFKNETGCPQYTRSIFSNSFYGSSSVIPYGKTCSWSTLYTGLNAGETIFGANPILSRQLFVASTEYLYSDQFFWTTIPVAEKIDQIRGPRDYNLGADFKDSNLIVRFSGMDAFKSARANVYVSELAAKVRWDLHVIVSITSAFIFNGDRAELMQ